jgi:hypothetical protein
MIELCHFVGRKLLPEYDDQAREVGYYGTVPYGFLRDYQDYICRMIKEDDEVMKMNEISEKAMDKFRKCRTPASSYSIKLAKEL